MEATKVAAVRYFNTTPLIDGLEHTRGLELVLTVPSRIAELLTDPDPARRVDMGLVSAVDLIRPGSGLVGVPVGMIGCRGETLTVRVFSKVPLTEIERLHADTDSHTSVVLAQWLLGERTGRRIPVADFNAREWIALEGGRREDEWPQAVLLIGDKVATHAPPAVRYPHQLDLGRAWHERTGLPFVYAMWACREADADTPRVRTLADILDRQRRRNAMRLDTITTQHARRLGWPDDLAREYLGRLLRYEVTPDARAGLERFAQACGETGLIPGARTRFADLEAPLTAGA